MVRITSSTCAVQVLTNCCRCRPNIRTPTDHSERSRRPSPPPLHPSHRQHTHPSRPWDHAHIRSAIARDPPVSRVLSYLQADQQVSQVRPRASRLPSRRHIVRHFVLHVVPILTLEQRNNDDPPNGLRIRLHVLLRPPPLRRHSPSSTPHRLRSSPQAKIHSSSSLTPPPSILLPPLRTTPRPHSRTVQTKRVPEVEDG